MECREFREVSESYLSDELLVETNIKVFRHLENCPKCRIEFAAKRELRHKMRNAVAQKEKFQVDTVFANRLRLQLKETALQKSGWEKFWFAPKFMIPTMASLLIIATLGLVMFNRINQNSEMALSQNAVTKALTKISLIAVGNHQDCALEKLEKWEAMSKLDYTEKAVYIEKVVKPLQAGFSENVELLHTHDCEFEGKEFKHVILRKGTHIVSVFVDKSDVLPEFSNSPTTILSNRENGVQVASFENNQKAIFVISDLSETENLSIARTLSASFQV